MTQEGLFGVDSNVKYKYIEVHMAVDILIKDGFVVDGTGGPWYRADVGIKDGKIVAVRSHLDNITADKVVDAEGYVVCPGFFDMHGHSELAYFKYPLTESKVMQGITTEFNSNCGYSANGPMKKLFLEMVKSWVEDPNTRPIGEYSFMSIPVKVDWSNLTGYMEKLNKFGGISLNSAYMVGFGSVRMSVIGYEKGPPTAAQLTRMKSMVAEAMEEGAFGISTGTQYPPQNYAETEEIIELAKVVAKYGGIHQSHIRRRGFTADKKFGRAFVKPTLETMFEAVRECIEIGEGAGIPTVWSHAKIAGAWTSSEHCAQGFLKLVDDARRRGVDVTIDTWANQYIGIPLTKVIPVWAFEGGINKLRKRLREPELRAKIRDFTEEALGHGCEGNIEGAIITRAEPEELKPFINRPIVEIAKEQGKSIVDFYLDIIADGGEIGLYLPCQSEEDNVDLIRYPATVFGTDAVCGKHEEKTGIGPGGELMGHGYGLFPRILRKYVLEEKVLTMEEAVRKMTSACANRLGITDRGLIKPGMWADVVVFDPIRIRERALLPPVGIPYVFVNGVVTVENGVHTGARAGKPLKHE